MDAMTTTERATLQAFEGVIEKGLASFVEVGNALMRIRDSRLYRETHGTFEAYCVERWHLSKAHVNRLVAASQVVESVAPVGVAPSNERQARPLTKLPEEDQAEVWQEAVETAPTDDDGEPIITARHVEQVVAKRLPTDDEKPATKSPASKPSRKADPFGAILLAIDDIEARFEVHSEPCDESDQIAKAFDKLRDLITYYARNVAA